MLHKHTSCNRKRPQLSGIGCIAGVAYWEYDYLNGATDSDNLVRRSDSTFTNILEPAAAAVVKKIAALPPVNGCVPGNSCCSTACISLIPCVCQSQLDCMHQPLPLCVSVTA